MSYRLKCRKSTESKNPKVVRTKNERIMILSKCEVCDSKKLKFIKEQEASGLLSSLGIKTPLNKIPLLGSLLMHAIKMSEIVNKFSCGPCTKIKNKLKKFKETGDSRYIYQQELGKACF